MFIKNSMPPETVAVSIPLSQAGSPLDGNQIATTTTTSSSSVFSFPDVDTLSALSDAVDSFHDQEVANLPALQDFVTKESPSVVVKYVGEKPFMEMQSRGKKILVFFGARGGYDALTALGVVKNAWMSSAVVQVDNVVRLAGNNIGYAIQRSDFVVVGIIAGLQVGYNVVQWWYGELTSRQFVKKTIGNIAGFAGGFVGAAGGVVLGGGAALALKAGTAVVFAGGIIGALLLGALCGWGAETLFRWLGEKFAPDQEAEQENVARLVFADAFQILGCQRSQSLAEVSKRFRELALLHHPDKAPPEQKATYEFHFKKIAAAYEICKQYLELLEVSKDCFFGKTATNAIDLDAIEARWRTLEASKAHEPFRKHYNRLKWCFQKPPPKFFQGDRDVEKILKVAGFLN
jgi:hypothetical protein